MDRPESAVQKMRRGHAAAAARQRDLLRAEGPRPAQAVAEALAGVTALATTGRWPGPRDPVSERAAEAVRRRWAHIQRRAREAGPRVPVDAVRAALPQEHDAERAEACLEGLEEKPKSEAT